MATDFSVKIGEIGIFTFILALVFGNEWQYRTSDFKRFTYNDLATL